MPDHLARVPSLRLVPDEPLDDAGLHSADGSARLEPAIAALKSLLSRWLEDTGAAEPAPRVGLFGGLGQGKSTVVRGVLERLRAQSRSGWQAALARWLFGAPVHRFDVSHYKADDLEWRFLTAVVWRRVMVRTACRLANSSASSIHTTRANRIKPL